jgi:hypothetical protein
MRPRLVYIASIGRSGSTLLELLLGAHPEIATVGELHLWPHALTDADSGVRCGCGCLLRACPFWAEIRTRADPLTAPPPRLDAFREHVNHGRALRPERLLDFWFDRSRADTEADTYAANTQRIMEAFTELAGTQTGHRPGLLVDASKDPYRLNWLARSRRFDLTVLHLVRDPRGFVHSESKNVEGIRGSALLRLAARKAVAWRLHNALVSRTRKLLPEHGYRLVRYEDLAAEPARVVAELQTLLGVTPDPSVVSDFRDRMFHAVGGNPMRHRAGGIALDERWRSELPAPAQRIARVLTLPASRSYR